MSELRERLIAAAMGVPLPFVAEFKSGREQELVAALGEEGAAKVVDALLALTPHGERRCCCGDWRQGCRSS